MGLESRGAGRIRPLRDRHGRSWRVAVIPPSTGMSAPWTGTSIARQGRDRVGVRPLAPPRPRCATTHRELVSPHDPDQRLVVYTAQPDSSTAATLPVLAAWGLETIVRPIP